MGGGGVGGGGGTAAPNPFASICLVPSVASASDEGVAPQPQPVLGLISDPLETIVALDKGDETEVLAKESDQPPTDANLEAKNDAVAIEVLGEEKLGLRLEEQSKALAKTGENGEASVGSAVGLVGSSSETFQQLSSAKNPFLGSFGTGFSSSTFTFGSTQDINRLFFFWLFLLVRVRVGNGTREFDKLHDSSYGFPISLQCVWQQKWQHDFVPAFRISSCGNCHSRVRGPKYARASPPRSSFTNRRRERKTGFCR